MKSSNFRATIRMRKIKRSFSYDNKTMLALSITYPEVALSNNRKAQGDINRRIQAQVNDFYKYASGYLYQQAISYYKDTEESGFPFHSYEAVLQYEITYNMNCHLSLYRDRYEFTGGAHGNTVRASDTWELTSGNNLPLSSFFAPGINYHEFLTEHIIGQAEGQARQEPMLYFEDYRELLAKYFNEKSYYLTPSGAALYFQQYEVAPYSSGIAVFIIPYEALQRRPSCSAL